MKAKTNISMLISLFLALNFLNGKAQVVLSPDFQQISDNALYFHTEIPGYCQEEFICKGRTSTNGANKIFTEMIFSVFGSPLYISFNLEYRGLGFPRFAVVDRSFNLKPIASSIQSKGYLHLTLDTISQVPIPSTPDTQHLLALVVYVVNEEHKDTYITSVDQLFSDTCICMPMNGDLSFALQATYQEPHSVPEIEVYYPEPAPGPTSTNQSYIRTRTMTSPSGNAYIERKDYYDGLGRAIQSVQTGITPTHGDLVTMKEYDVYGRQLRDWLPIFIHENSGSYVHPDSVISKAREIYDNDSKAYNFISYEESPLEVINGKYGAGEDWYKKKKCLHSGRFANTLNADTLMCVEYAIMENPTNDTVVIINKVGDYYPNELYVTRMEDEDNNVSLKFENRIGQTLLTRRILDDGNIKKLCDTYYIYDGAGNLRAVLPPLAVDAMATDITWSNEFSDIIRNYVYLYKYDDRNRCIAKRIPGKQWVRYIYDKANRIILSQDGVQREKNEWMFSIPDAFGRVVLTGICIDSPDYGINSLADKIVRADWDPNNSKAHWGYVITGIELSSPKILTASYYDRYDFLTLSGFSNFNLSYTSSGIDADYLQRYGDDLPQNRYMHKGLLTGSVSAVLNSNESSSFLYAAMYYDNKKRLIQLKETNYLGGIDAHYTAYNFVGEPIHSTHTHTASGKQAQTEAYAYAYDHAGRLLTTTHQLNNGPVVTLNNNEYDELGRLICNKRNGQPNLKTDYAYNLRSWTKSIISPLFCQTLYYNDKRAGNGTHGVCYNGNISAMDWSAGDAKVRGYDFSYDNLSRLRDASYLEGNVKSSKFNASYRYDKHGNMLSLTRSGNRGTNTYGVVDNLTLSYSGNQLVKVEDTAPSPSLSMSMDFKDGASQSVEYAYDANGNQTQDLNKGISNIEYNILNLPRRISFNGTNHPVNEYVYSATGAKLSVIHRSSTEKRTDYVGNMVYENGSLKRILVDEGYIEGGEYYFYLQDHLGNNRVVAKGDGTVIQTNHYYPYGMTFAESTSRGRQPYKYNGKEFDSEHGLNLYDYEARQMDGAFGRFTSIDAMAEKYYEVSPYIYVGNNPLKYIDPTGNDWYKIWNSDEEWDYRYDPEIHSQDDLNKMLEGGIYLGMTHTENNVYYSLFGSKKTANSFEGAIYQKIDNAIIKEARAALERLDDTGIESISSPTTDFSISGINAKDSKFLGIDSHRNEYSIEYENSSSGIYTKYTGKNAMKGKMEDWVGYSDEPKVIHGYFSGDSKPMYHIRFINELGRGSDIIHLKYDASASRILLNKYYNLFPELKK